MKLVRRRPGAVFPAFPRFFDEFLNDDFFTRGVNPSETIPAVNIKENDTNFELEVAVPGLEREDINLEIKDDVLTISSKKENKTEVVEDEGRYSRKEFSFRAFQRMFTLPKSVDKTKIKASYKNGVLNVDIPKGTVAENVKKIEIAG